MARMRRSCPSSRSANEKQGHLGIDTFSLTLEKYSSTGERWISEGIVQGSYKEVTHSLFELVMVCTVTTGMKRSTIGTDECSHLSSDATELTIEGIQC